MSKLPTISGKKLVRMFKKFDFVAVRQSSSHIIMEHADGRMVSVPVHGSKDLPKGTLHSILRDAGIPPESLQRMN